MGETTEMTGGEALARMLVAHEIGPMFGMGGFQLLPFYDAARRLGIDHNLVNDERCGVFAADAYAKVTGRVGVCDATLGPGATNLLTGMVEALNAGTPLVLIAGDSHRDHSWKNMTQESRQMEILRPAAKELIRVESIRAHPGARAPRLRGGDAWAARSGGARRPGGRRPCSPCLRSGGSHLRSEIATRRRRFAPDPARNRSRPRFRC